ncbi:MAG: flagellar motor protein MotB [Candidatus Brocadiia bacterium]
MSRGIKTHEHEPHGAPRWYVGFSTLTTILMTFFIILTVNGASMNSKRNLGYAGPGSGIFRQGFTDHGTPGLLRGARRVAEFFSWGDKFLPEDTPEGQGEVYTGRLIEMPDRDLKQALSHLVKSVNDVVLPLPLSLPAGLATGRPEPLNEPARAELAAAARLIRQTDHSVMVCATLPAENSGQPPDEALRRAAEWALLIGRYLAETEKIPADRLMAIGRVATPDSKGGAAEASVTLVMRPKVVYGSSPLPEADPLRRKPVTQYEVVR